MLIPPYSRLRNAINTQYNQPVFQKDLGHYSPQINSWMLEAIRQQNGLLSTSNIKQYLDVFEQKSLKYDAIAVG